MYSFIGLLLIFAVLVQSRIEVDLYEHKPSEKHVKRLFKRSLQRDVRFNDSVVLNKFLNGEYYGEIKVGSPAKTFKVIFDTTWADSWLPSSHCSWNEIVCKLHTQYDSSASSSYVPNETRFINITDNQFSLWGFLATDTFHLAHINLPNQTFLEATHLSINPFWHYRADGFIGLAFKEHTLFNVTPFFYNLIRQGLIKENIFTFYMNRDETTTRAGKLILGGTQRSHVQNDTLTTLKVTEKSYWMIKIDNIFARMNKTDYPIINNIKAFFDTSANAITGPADAIMKLNYMLNAIYVPYLNMYSVNCRKYAKLPTIHFVMNGTEFIIQSKYYVQRMTFQNIEACFSPFVPNPDPNSSVWELGGAFMMEFYTEFDMDNSMVRIGQTIF
ncbi:lysosomal aspartic protease-like [Phymastichus coffea]|uniref:lysosomal aspartic protease-like n=1 Tax=Phymastichus coffea TaxID=108790 RepID=UPI00273C77A0|nr:lysosomal aspartic protease-like [Phymastichus coffea]